MIGTAIALFFPRMPSLLHQTIVRLFDEQPALLDELLPTRRQRPPGRRLRPIASDLTTLVPAELRADLVIAEQHEDEDGPHALYVVEVQLSAPPKKRRIWPHYSTSLHHRFGCPVTLIVITPYQAVARWARKPIIIGPGHEMRPLVIGPDAIPPILDANRARDNPELSVLSSLAHPERGDIAYTALAAVSYQDDEHVRIYADIVLACLAPAGRARLEKLIMDTTRYEYQSDFAKKYVAIGRQEARQEALQIALFRLLEARGIPINDTLRQQITDTSSCDRLDRWIGRAAKMTSLHDIFER
jgi:hypothetical protein